MTRSPKAGETMTVDTDEFSSEQIDAGAEALRQYEQAGKRLNSWE